MKYKCRGRKGCHSTFNGHMKEKFMPKVAKKHLKKEEKEAKKQSCIREELNHA
jgi:hypothetical protein